MPLLFNIVLDVLATAIGKEKEIKQSKLERKSKTVTVCSDLILYIENFIRKCYQKTTKTHQ